MKATILKEINEMNMYRITFRVLRSKLKLYDMTKEELAKWLHENYEEIAKDKKWNTQENCKVEFDTLPEQNKQTMLEIADRLLNFNLLSQHFVSERSELLLALCDCGYMADKNNICTGRASNARGWCPSSFATRHTSY